MTKDEDDRTATVHYMATGPGYVLSIDGNHHHIPVSCHPEQSLDSWRSMRDATATNVVRGAREQRARMGPRP